MNAAQILKQSHHDCLDAQALNVMALAKDLSHSKKIKLWLASVGNSWQWSIGDAHLKRIHDFYNRPQDEEYEHYSPNPKQLASLAILEISRSTYFAGRRLQLLDLDLLSTRPYWRLSLTDNMDSLVACPHQKRKQLIYPADHAFWLNAFPCDQLACDCDVHALAADELL